MDMTFRGTLFRQKLAGGMTILVRPTAVTEAAENSGRTAWTSFFGGFPLYPQCTPKVIYTAFHECSATTQCQANQCPRISGSLCQQRANASECVGFFPGFRHRAATERNSSGDSQLSGHLPEPATSQGATWTAATERLRLRDRLRRDQTGSSDEPWRPGALDVLGMDSQSGGDRTVGDVTLFLVCTVPIDCHSSFERLLPAPGGPF